MTDDHWSIIRRISPLFRRSALSITIIFNISLCSCIDTKEKDAYSVESVKTCIDQLAARIRTQKPEDAAMSSAVNLCDTIINLEHQSNEQFIRAENFIFQRGENTVLMWMVVFITIGGVILAGAQLWWSYKLANQNFRTEAIQETDNQADKNMAKSETVSDLATRQSYPFAFGAEVNEFNLSRHQIAVKSSYVGVIVLAASFAFFLVFVLWVYAFDKSKGAENAAITPTGSPVSVAGAPGNFQPATPAAGTH